MAFITPPPLDGHLFNTFKELLTAIQNHAKQKGWAIIKTRANNRRVDRNYYRYDLVYDRGINTHKNKLTGRRIISSRKEKYPWIGYVITLKFNNDHWTYKTINSIHNHLLSQDAFIHPIHRRIIDEDRNAIRRYKKAGSCLNVIVTNLREQYPEVKKRNILNEKAKLERAVTGPYTQT